MKNETPQVWKSAYQGSRSAPSDQSASLWKTWCTHSHTSQRIPPCQFCWRLAKSEHAASSRFRQKGCPHLIGPLVRWVGRFLALSSAVGPDNTTGVRMANAKLLLLLLLHTVLFTLVVRSAYISESWAMLTSDRPSAPKCVEIPRNLTLCYGIQVSLFGKRTSLIGKRTIVKIEWKIFKSNKHKLSFMGLDFSIGTFSRSPLKRNEFTWKRKETLFVHHYHNSIWTVWIVELCRTVFAISKQIVDKFYHWFLSNDGWTPEIAAFVRNHEPFGKERAIKGAEWTNFSYHWTRTLQRFLSSRMLRVCDLRFIAASMSFSVLRCFSRSAKSLHKTIQLYQWVEKLCLYMFE